jgi:hypothetical protein
VKCAKCGRCPARCDAGPHPSCTPSARVGLPAVAAGAHLICRVRVLRHARGEAHHRFLSVPGIEDSHNAVRGFVAVELPLPTRDRPNGTDIPLVIATRFLRGSL